MAFEDHYISQGRNRWLCFFFFLLAAIRGRWRPLLASVNKTLEHCFVGLSPQKQPLDGHYSLASWPLIPLGHSPLGYMLW